MPRATTCTFAFLVTAALAAQTTVVDYPDSVLNVPQGQYPIYTGTGTNVIRGQLFCPTTFAGLPTSPRICRKIGVQLSNTANYARFELRAGVTSIAALTNTWATNLPDQRLQLNLSGTQLSGGAAANIWVEWPLAYPFYWKPGDAIVLDIISQAAVALQYCSTAIGTGVPRLIDTNFVGNQTGPTPSTSGGIKFRMVFETPGVIEWGTGCAGSGSFVPTIGSTGASSVGSANFIVTLANALGPAPSVFMLGLPAQLDLGGGCKLYNNLTVTFGGVTSGTGPGTGRAAFPLLIPNDPSLLMGVFDVQWAVVDPASLAFLPVTTSPGGKVVIY